ncbi:hypothetical protein V6R21_22085 [Limibacter armeniacum]|uniref:hypothetical protein n=1 Tax=Limibacter armeniacum TaxID=466084 RepID=UPI002FE673B7
MRMLKVVGILLLFCITNIVAAQHIGSEQEFEELKVASRSGKPEALFTLGQVYEEGRYQKQNLKKSFEYYKQASQSGYVPALLALGRCYQVGIGTKPDLAQSFYYYSKAAEAKDGEGFYHVGDFYLNGVNVAIDTVKAIENFLKAWELENPDAEAVLRALPLSDFPQSDNIIYKRFLAKDGTPENQYEIGRSYLLGEGVEKDAKKALTYLESALAEGSADAALLIGTAYKNGDGLNPDSKKAVLYLLKAANLGSEQAIELLDQMDIQALADHNSVDYLHYSALLLNDKNDQYRLYHMYREGVLVKQDLNKALEFCQRAALQDHGQAMLELATMYRKGLLPLKKNALAAFKWYSKAAFADIDTAKYVVGEFYETGEAIDADTASAVKWYLQAANNGVQIAQFKLTRLDVLKYIDQNDVEYVTYQANLGNVSAQLSIAKYYIMLNGSEALGWLRKAEEQNSMEAVVLLGDIYLEGKCDVIPNEAEALRFYDKALAAGLPEAKLRMSRYYLISKGGTGEADPTDLALDFLGAYLQDIEKSGGGKLNLMAYEVKGDIYKRKQNVMLAINGYTQYIKNYEDSPYAMDALMDVMFKRAELLYEIGQFQSAQLESEIALAKLETVEEPVAEKGRWIYLRGKALLKQGDVGQGCKLLKEAKEMGVEIEPIFERVCLK